MLTILKERKVETMQKLDKRKYKKRKGKRSRREAERTNGRTDTRIAPNFSKSLNIDDSGRHHRPPTADRRRHPKPERRRTRRGRAGGSTRYILHGDVAGREWRSTGPSEANPKTVFG